MAITIIKGGKNEFVVHCKWCGCDFRYTEEELFDGARAIACPFCTRRLDHLGECGTSSAPPYRLPPGYDYWQAACTNTQQEQGWAQFIAMQSCGSRGGNEKGE